MSVKDIPTIRKILFKPNKIIQQQEINVSPKKLGLPFGFTTKGAV